MMAKNGRCFLVYLEKEKKSMGTQTHMLESELSNFRKPCFSVSALWISMVSYCQGPLLAWRWVPQEWVFGGSERRTQSQWSNTSRQFSLLLETGVSIDIWFPTKARKLAKKKKMLKECVSSPSSSLWVVLSHTDLHKLLLWEFKGWNHQTWV